MRIQPRTQITINASAREVWCVIAHEYENIDQWCSNWKHSSNKRKRCEV